MKDRISLVAAAAGGLMLSLAAASIIHAAPVTALKSPASIEAFHRASEQRSLSQNDRNRIWQRDRTTNDK